MSRSCSHIRQGRRVRGQRFAAIAAAAVMVGAASVPAYGQLTVTEWRGEALPNSEPPVFPGQGNGNWFSVPQGSSDLARAPWTNGVPAETTTNLQWHAVVGASRNEAPTGTYTVNVWSPLTGPLIELDQFSLAKLSVGTDYVLRFEGRGSSSSSDPFPQRQITLTTVSASLINNGRIEIIGFNSSTGNGTAALRVAANTTVGGRGSVRLGGILPLSSSESRAQGGIIGAPIGPSNDPLRGFVHDTDHSITGFGAVERLRENRGTIVADVANVGALKPVLSVLWIAPGSAPTAPPAPPTQGTVVNSGTLRATGGGTLSLGISVNKLRNDGVIEAVGAGSRVIMGRAMNPLFPEGFIFPAGHKPRAVDGGSIEARGWTLHPDDIDFVGSGNMLAVAQGGTIDNAGQTYTVPAGVSLEVGNGGTLTGGTINTTSPIVVPEASIATLENVSVNGPINVDPTSSLNLAGTVGGNLEVNGSATIVGTLSPGNSPGVASVSGNLVLAEGGSLQIELGLTSDFLDIGGLLDLSADDDTLELAGGVLGTQYHVGSFGSYTGSFGTVTGNLPGYQIELTGGNLFVTPVPEPGAVSFLSLTGLLGLRRRGVRGVEAGFLSWWTHCQGIGVLFIRENFRERAGVLTL